MTVTRNKVLEACAARVPKMFTCGRVTRVILGYLADTRPRNDTHLPGSE